MVFCARCDGVITVSPRPVTVVFLGIGFGMLSLYMYAKAIAVWIDSCPRSMPSRPCSWSIPTVSQVLVAQHRFNKLSDQRRQVGFEAGARPSIAGCVGLA